jgi:hypothetical protein
MDTGIYVDDRVGGVGDGLEGWECWCLELEVGYVNVFGIQRIV